MTILNIKLVKALPLRSSIRKFPKGFGLNNIKTSTTLKEVVQRRIKRFSPERPDNFRLYKRKDFLFDLRTTDLGTVKYSLSRHTFFLMIKRTRIPIWSYRIGLSKSRFSSVVYVAKGLLANQISLGVTFNSYTFQNYLISILNLIAFMPYEQVPSICKEALFMSQCAVLSRAYPGTTKVSKPKLSFSGYPFMMKLHRAIRLPLHWFQEHIYIMELENPGSSISMIRPLEVIPGPVSNDISTVTTRRDPDTNPFLNYLLTVISDTPLGRRLVKQQKHNTHLAKLNASTVCATVAGPNGDPSYRMLSSDITGLLQDQSLWGSVKKLIGLYGSEPLNNIIQRLECNHTPNSRLKRQIHSRITTIPDGKFGKTRVVAMGDQISQSLLTGLNEVMMDCLKHINQDLTFKQGQLDTSLYYWTMKHGDKQRRGLPFTSDATAFTDRLPSELNKELLTLLWGPETADLWYDVVCRRTFDFKGSKVNYKVGTPMGTLTSWSSSALVHHLIVQSCHVALGYSSQKSMRYLVLGDDIAIWDEEVYKLYVDVMKSIGVEINANKSTCSRRYCELAKRLFVMNAPGTDTSSVQEVTGLPGAAAGHLFNGDAMSIMSYLIAVKSRSSGFVAYGAKWRLSHRHLTLFSAAPVARILDYLRESSHTGWKTYSAMISCLASMTLDIEGDSLKEPQYAKLWCEEGKKYEWQFLSLYENKGLAQYSKLVQTPLKYRQTLKVSLLLEDLQDKISEICGENYYSYPGNSFYGSPGTPIEHIFGQAKLRKNLMRLSKALGKKVLNFLLYGPNMAIFKLDEILLQTKYFSELDILINSLVLLDTSVKAKKITRERIIANVRLGKLLHKYVKKRYYMEDRTVDERISRIYDYFSSVRSSIDRLTNKMASTNNI